MDIIKNLEHSGLFGGLETSLLQKIAPLCRTESFKKGDIIFREGDKATELYILVQGMLALEMNTRPVPDSPEIVTSTVEVSRDDDCFGWSAVVEPYIFTLSARCLTNCIVLIIKGDMLRKLMNDDLRIGFKLMERIAHLIALRLIHTRQRLLSGLSLTPARKKDMSEAQ